MKKVYILLLILCGTINYSFSQNSYWAINWDISTGLGETGDFVQNVNFRGFSVEGRSFINSNVSIGGFFAWDVLTDKVTDANPIPVTIEGTPGHISGTQVNYLNILPILFTSHYYFKSEGTKTPTFYVGGGIGGVFVKQRSDIGLRSYTDDSFGIGFQPEIGSHIPFGYSGSGMNVALRYLYSPSAASLDALSTLSLSVGFSFLN